MEPANGRVSILIAAVLCLSVASVAGAEPAGETEFVPISVAMSTTGNTVVVEKGDHLWKISASHLDSVLRREAKDSEIAPYWRDVIETNRDQLRSGDPDLIYPGEVVLLPEAG